MIDIPTAIKNLGITEWVLYGDPTSEEEFNSMFRKIVGVNENGTAKKSEDPKDFGVTWSQITKKKKELEDAEPLNEVRIERNKLLEQTDWMSLPDAPTMSDAWKKNLEDNAPK